MTKTQTSSLFMATTGYTAAQKLRNYVLIRATDFDDDLKALVLAWSKNPSSESLDVLYEHAEEQFPDSLQDARSECRGGDEVTDVPVKADFRILRHYDATSVAAQMPDGSWIGWINFHGGGKHGEPEAIEWMQDAYHLDVKEEEKIVVVRTFSVPKNT